MAPIIYQDGLGDRSDVIFKKIQAIRGLFGCSSLDLTWISKKELPEFKWLA